MASRLWYGSHRAESIIPVTSGRGNESAVSPTKTPHALKHCATGPVAARVNSCLSRASFCLCRLSTRGLGLEAVPQTELHGSRLSEGFEASDLSDAGTGQIVHREASVHVVQDVEVLPRECPGLTFGELESFAEFPVRLEEALAPERVASRVAFAEGESGIAQDGCYRYKCVRIEPQSGGHVRLRISDLKCFWQGDQIY